MKENDTLNRVSDYEQGNDDDTHVGQGDNGETYLDDAVKILDLRRG